MIGDHTYFVAEGDGGSLIACGGWSRRQTLFGGDQQAGRTPRTLDPVTEAARIRAFFVDPGWARSGIGRALLQRCEAEVAEGFRAVGLMATLPANGLYQAAGYVARRPVEHPLGPGLTLTIVPMRKTLVR